MKSSKKRAEKNQNLDAHMVTLHQRLYQALNLGIKSDDDNRGKKKWQCTDIEIQRLAVRSISAFVGCITTTKMLRQQLIKDSVDDMFVALGGILQSRNEALIGMATNATMKLVDIVGSSILLYHVSDMVHSLSVTISCHEPSIAVSCAITLRKILLKLLPRGSKKHNELFEILVEGQVVDHIVSGLCDFVFGAKPLEYFEEMASLLKTLLLQWPPFRYPVWNNTKLVESLAAVFQKEDSPVEIVLQLYSALALCGNVAMKLLGSEASFLPQVVCCMGSSQPHPVRVEAFKLLQCLVRSEQGCLATMKLCCESIIKATTDAMDAERFSAKSSAAPTTLVAEACRFALIARWAGDHHTYFWKFGIHKVLLDLLSPNYSKSKQCQAPLSLQEVIAISREGLNSNYNVVLWPYIWDIIGGLATHSGEHFKPETAGGLNCLNILVACTCLVFANSIQKGRRASPDVDSYTSMYEPASRAVLLMIYSSCKYISSVTRDILLELHILNTEYLEYLLVIMKSTADGTFRALDNLRSVLTMMHLACYLGLPKYRDFTFQGEPIKIISTFIGWCLSNHIQIRRSTLAPHLNSLSDQRTCCWLGTDNWEGCDILLFFSLWGLAELFNLSSPLINNRERTSGQMVGGIELEDHNAQVLVNRLQEIFGNTFSPGCRWYAAYALSFFGLYGFPSRLGKRIGKGLEEKDLADVILKLATGEAVGVHGVVLIVRCPSMLPTEECLPNWKMPSGLATRQDREPLCKKYKREACLSSRVNHEILMKLLEFIYKGFVEVSDDLVKQLKILAKSCGMHFVSRMLGRKRPKWGVDTPLYDLTPALGSAGHHFTDILLEAKETIDMLFNCSSCTRSIPHMHAHKIVLWLSCDYLRALFQSGMQESNTQVIKVPVSWEALNKLICWFYLDELPKPSSGCLWENMDIEQQLHELHPFIELCWLSEFWIVEEIREDALKVVQSYLNSNAHLCIKVMQIAVDLSQWEIASMAADKIARSYPQMRNTGGLEALNEELVDMLRVAYVRLTQEGGADSISRSS